MKTFEICQPPQFEPHFVKVQAEYFIVKDSGDLVFYNADWRGVRAVSKGGWLTVKEAEYGTLLEA